MFRPRIIPVLLLKKRALVKSVRFGRHQYIGDPINAVRIFNDLRADELVFLDIEASKEDRLVSLELVKDIGEEALMPFSVGGGIRSLDDIGQVLAAGAEKVVINTHAGNHPDFIRRAADAFASSSIVVCIDARRKFLRGSRAWVCGGSVSTRFTPLELARIAEDMGAGEIIVQSIERDGTMTGYDTELIRSISTAVKIPVVALGGAGDRKDLEIAYREGRADALAAGSMFVYRDRGRGVLINYPEKRELSFE